MHEYISTRVKKNVDDLILVMHSYLTSAKSISDTINGTLFNYLYRYGE